MAPSVPENLVTAGTIGTSEGRRIGADRSFAGSLEVTSLGDPGPETNHPTPDQDDGAGRAEPSGAAASRAGAGAGPRRGDSWRLGLDRRGGTVPARRPAGRVVNGEMTPSFSMALTASLARPSRLQLVQLLGCHQDGTRLGTLGRARRCHAFREGP